MTREALVRLGVAASSLSPVGARRVRDACGSWEAAERAAAGGEPAVPARWREVFAGAARAGERAGARARATGTRVLFRGEPAWPNKLECLTDPPEVLFVRGGLGPLEEPAVAIVGTRECTPEGRRLAGGLARRLAEAGTCVVSGLARGIDTAAHEGALGAGGDTVAVLGCGADVVYPSENRALQTRIAQDGALVSEFAPGSEPRPRHFPRRNRILAALAAAVVVLEARLRSGALVTARHALDQGKEIFVVPGWPGSALAAGPLALLRDGARPIRHADDLLEDLRGISGGPPPAPWEAEARQAAAAGARTPEALAAALGIGEAEARERLALLELLGAGGSDG